MYPTRAVGDGTLLATKLVAANFCRLIGLVGHNNGADCYMQIHESATVPSAGAVPKFSVLATGGLPYSFALPAAVDMAACYVVASSELDTYTATGGTPVTVQALIAS